MSAAVAEKRKPLISIKDLKQYFPVRGKRNMFVKANDGITLDIFEGETLGVVGESGCGKSTLGRVLLQLYNQTDGETIYYGRSLESIAPLYALDIYKNLAKKCASSKEATKKLEMLEAEYEKLEAATKGSEDQAKLKDLYAKLNEKNQFKSKAHNEFISIVRLVGGFYASKDFDEVTRVLVDYYKSLLTIKSIEIGLTKTNLDIAELEYKSNKEPNQKNESKLESLKKQRDKVVDNELKNAKNVRDQKFATVEALRESYKDDAEFQKYEAYRDDGVDLASLNYDEMRHLRKDLQIIFQDPYSSLNPRLTVGQIISEGPLTHSKFESNNERASEYTMQVMENCGLASYMIHRYPHQFSGGQRQRIGIARALAVEPKFVVCDEAVSALDVSIQSQIINLLKDLKDKENLTYMFISHDLSVVKYISDRIAVMYLGNIVELCTSQKMFDKPLHPYTVALLSAIPTTDADSKDKDMIILEGDIPSPVNPPKGCKFNTRCIDVMDICKEVVPVWKEQEPEHFVACHKYN